MRSVLLRLPDGGEISLMSTQGTLERMRGLLARAPLKADEAMAIEDCNMIHTVGMSYAIDVVFLDRNFKILRICNEVPTWRIRTCVRAKRVIELVGGEARRFGWTVGASLAY